MRVKSCSAFTENSRPIDLSDEHGCVLRPKMISKFMKIAGADTRATVVTYAFFHAFKFPDSMAVNIRCKVTPVLGCLYGIMILVSHSRCHKILRDFHSIRIKGTILNIFCTCSLVMQVEICRYGCPDHCQRPNSYTAREQEVSASVAVPQYTKPQQQPRTQLQYKPGPRFEAHRTPGAGQICCKYFYNVCAELFLSKNFFKIF